MSKLEQVSYVRRCRQESVSFASVTDYYEPILLLTSCIVALWREQALHEETQNAVYGVWFTRWISDGYKQNMVDKLLSILLPLNRAAGERGKFLELELYRQGRLTSQMEARERGYA